MEKATFIFDSRSPWTYLVSRWLRRLEALGELDLDWGLYSLEVANLKEHEDPRTLRAEYGPALRTAALVRDRFDSKKMGDFYSAVGYIMWEGPVDPYLVENTIKHAPLDVTSREALEVIGLDPGLVDEALADQATWQTVIDDTYRWRNTLQVFGVPTIVYNGGEGPAVFGPVIRDLLDDETCVELWRHVSWLVHQDTFFELKQPRPMGMRANLPNAQWRASLRVRQMVEARPLLGEGGPYEGASLDWVMTKLLEQAQANPPS